MIVKYLCLSVLMFIAFGGIHYQFSLLKSQRILTEEPTESYLRKNLRFLTLGTSRTWGWGIQNRTRAYPYLLGEQIHNIATKSFKPDYPALCAESMVGKGSYDVIILEYNQEANDFLPILAKRLRQRFPNAAIVFLHIWLPLQYQHAPTNQSLLGIMQENRVEASRMYNLTHLIEMVKPLDDEWTFRESPEQRARVFQTAADVNGHVWEMPRPESVVEALEQYGHLYTSNMNHFTNQGHEYLDEKIMQLLKEDIQPVRSNLLGSWQDRDMCQQGYYSRESSSWDATQFRRALNHASSTSSGGPDEGKFGIANGTIHVRNPFVQSVHLWIDFMVDYSVTPYPKGRVGLVDPDSKEKRKGVALDPPSPPKVNATETETETRAIHHAFVGTLEADEQLLLQLEAVEGETTESLQIVGIVYTTVDVAKKQFVEIETVENSNETQAINQTAANGTISLLFQNHSQIDDE